MNKFLKVFVVICCTAFIVIAGLSLASAALLKYLGIQQLDETFLKLEDNIVVIEKDPPPSD